MGVLAEDAENDGAAPRGMQLGHGPTKSGLKSASKLFHFQYGPPQTSKLVKERHFLQPILGIETNVGRPRSFRCMGSP